jgi:hypothetical protein
VFQFSSTKDFKEDVKLREEILRILFESYQNPMDLLERAYKNNDFIYLCRDENHLLCGFFMVGQNSINGDKIIYLGLSGVLDSKKGLGIGKSLYTMHYDEIKHKKGIVCWATTASIAVYKTLEKIYGNIIPNETFEYDPKYIDLVREIFREKKWVFDTKNPFLGKNIAHNTNYLQTETNRLKKIRNIEKWSFFEKIGLNEGNGDRLIMIFRI